MLIRILWIGKTRSVPIKSLVGDYRDRLSHIARCDVVELPDLPRRRGFRSEELRAREAQLVAKALAAHSRRVVLEERGRQFSSVEFARWFESEQNRGTRTVEFVIGGPDGLGREILKGAHLVLSLGKMTWTHEMSRLLLLEQIYRAHCIMRNIPYHK